MEKDILTIRNTVDMMTVRLDGYHKRLGDNERNLEGLGARFGERIGGLETETAVQQNKIEATETSYKKIETRLWWVMVFLIMTLGATVGNLIAK